MTKKKNKNVFNTLWFIALFFALFPSCSHAVNMTEQPKVRLQSLDKITAKTVTFEADVGATLKFDTMYIKVETCQKSSPLDEPESSAFVQVWEVDAEDNAEWVFSGWMFASSPGLSSMDHAIYDVWLIACFGAQEDIPPAQPETEIEGDELAPLPAETQSQGDILQ